MLIGNTGVGKSSLGCRLLGVSPIGAKEPFEVGDSANAVTTALKHADGTWFSQPGRRLRVVDTPGDICNDKTGCCEQNRRKADKCPSLALHIRVSCVFRSGFNVVTVYFRFG